MAGAASTEFILSTFLFDGTELENGTAPEPELLNRG